MHCHDYWGMKQQEKERLTHLHFLVHSAFLSPPQALPPAPAIVMQRLARHKLENLSNAFHAAWFCLMESEHFHTLPATPPSPLCQRLVWHRNQEVINRPFPVSLLDASYTLWGRNQPPQDLKVPTHADHHSVILLLYIYPCDWTKQTLKQSDIAAWNNYISVFVKTYYLRVNSVFVKTY